jgi:hypothetical protein
MKNPFRNPFIHLVIVLGVLCAAYIFGRSRSVVQSGLHSSAIIRQKTPPQGQTATAITILARDEAHQRFIELMNDATSADFQGVKRLTQFASSINPADIPDLMALAVSLPESRQRDIVFDILIKLWGHTDPQAAMNWALGLPTEDGALINSAIVDIGSVDPQLVESYLNQMTDAALRDKDIRAIGAGIGKNDPSAALDWLTQMATGATYDTAVNNLFVHLTQPTVTEQMTPEGKHAIIIATSGYKPDIPTAISLLDNLTDPSIRGAAIDTIATNWSNTDPNAALAWAQNLPDTESASAFNSIVAIWLKSDPAAAATYVQNSPDQAAFLSTDPALAQTLAASNPQAALDFAYSLPDGEAKNQALNNVLVSMAPLDFTDAWTDAAALPVADNPVGIMTNLVGTLANKDPAQAAGLIAQFPAGAAQDSVTSTVAAIWVSQDPQAFTVWLTSLQPGDVRDTAIAALVSSSQAAKNPAGVLEWVNTVSNPQIKAALLQQLALARTAAAP